MTEERASTNTDYIRYIRDRVGSDPVILVGAVVVAVNRDGAILMQHRSDNDRWSFPGGMLEMGEALEDAAKREFKEETGRTITDLSLLGVASGADHFYEYPNGDQVWNVSAIYACRLDSDKFEVSEETRGLRWISLDQFSSIPLSPPTARVIEDIQMNFWKHLQSFMKATPKH